MSLTCNLLLKLERKLFEIPRDKAGVVYIVYLKKKEILFLARAGFVSLPRKIRETKL